jgi:Reverse transcriptase (RNA-dependent DNA polymerase)
MLHGAGLHQVLWGEAVSAATYIQNRCPTRGVEGEKTPFEVFYGHTPSVQHLRTWGCKVAVHIKDMHRNKFDSKSWEGIMVGYGTSQKGYRIYDPKARDVTLTRDVVFFEEELLEGNGKEVIGDDGPLNWPSNDVEQSDPTIVSKPPTELEYESAEDDGHFEEPPPKKVQHKSPTLIVEDGASKDASPQSHASKEDDSDSGSVHSKSSEDMPLLEFHEDEEEADEENIQNEHEQSIESENTQTVVNILDEQKIEPQVRRSSRVRKPSVTFGYDKPGVPNADANKYGAYLAAIEDGMTYKEAITSSESTKWREAIRSEMESLKENHTWDLVTLPKDRKAIGCKWIFKKKDLPGGENKFKARLVAKGFSQVEGIDYDETFAPVMKYQSLRILMALANEERMHVHQMDVTTAFLYGELQEEIFMLQPEGQVKVGEEELVCKLKKSLYGLKQSPRCWNHKIHTFLLSLGFKALKTDSALYTMGADKVKIIIGLYVDDLLIASKDLNFVLSTKASLSANFKMTDFQEVETVLGIKIERNKERGELRMGQEKYTTQILERFGFSKIKPMATPI